MLRRGLPAAARLLRSRAHPPPARRRLCTSKPSPVEPAPPEGVPPAGAPSAEAGAAEVAAGEGGAGAAPASSLKETILKAVRPGAAEAEAAAPPPTPSLAETTKEQIISLYEKYTQALTEAPLRTNALVAGCLCTVGDALAQVLEFRLGITSPDKTEYNWRRTFNMAVWGSCISGPVFTVWYRSLHSASQALRVSCARPASTRPPPAQTPTPTSARTRAPSAPTPLDPRLAARAAQTSRWCLAAWSGSSSARRACAG